jgi:FKBP-type peptidyl-prolyl cis-trans isomerase
MKYLVLTLFLSMGCGDAQETESSASAEKAQAIDKTKSKKKTTAEKGSTDKTLKKLKSKEIPAPDDVAATPKDAMVTSTGLAYKVLSKGKGGEKPTEDATVTVHYTGWTTDGKMFDSSVTRGKTIDFPLKGVIAGWTEGLQLMEVGEKTRFWIPEDLAYKGQKGAPAGLLVFDVELISFQEPPKAPDDVAAAPSDAMVTSTGLAYKVLSKGKGGEKPEAKANVKVDYTGWTTDGKMFDSSVTRGKPAEFPLDRVIAGWTEGLQLMEVGEKTRFWIPENLAYQGKPGRPAGMLVFDVELLSFTNPLPPPPVPKDVAAAPSDAMVTSTGLAYKVLSKGKGGEKPEAKSSVKVHYSGWTTDGKMFDSSVTRGKPAEFPLRGVIAGWTEGLQLMEVGEKTRFWIPENSAYQGKPGRPAGMLVFDVELLEIK